MKPLIRTHLELKKVLLNLSNQYKNFCFLDSSNNKGTFDWMVGLSHAPHNKCCAEYNSFSDLENFFLANKGKFLFGHLNYDLKNNFENLHSHHYDNSGFSVFNFFVPEVVFICRNNAIEIWWDDEVSVETQTLVKMLCVEKDLVRLGIKRELNLQEKKPHFIPEPIRKLIWKTVRKF